MRTPLCAFRVWNVIDVNDACGIAPLYNIFGMQDNYYGSHQLASLGDMLEVRASVVY